MPSEELNVAVIGAGMIGKAHANGYRQATTVYDDMLPRVRLAAIADSNYPLAQDAARRYGYEKAYASWEDVAEDPSINVVSIALGNALHLPVATAMIEAGKNVLCEKPLADTLENARAMAALESATDVTTGVGYSYRRVPAIAEIARRVAAGDLGTITHFRGVFDCDFACDPRAPMSWRYKGPIGSGALGDTGSHIIDLSELMCGPIVEVSGARVSTSIAERAVPTGAVVGHGLTELSDVTEPVENEDTAAFTARFRNGALGVFETSRVAFGPPDGLAFAISGVRGRAAFDWSHATEYVYDDDQTDAMSHGDRIVIAGPQFPYYAGGIPVDAAGFNYGYADMFTFQCRAFLEQAAGVDNGLPPCGSFADGLHTVEVIQAAADSAEAGGRTVTIPSAR